MCGECWRCQAGKLGGFLEGGIGFGVSKGVSVWKFAVMRCCSEAIACFTKVINGA